MDITILSNTMITTSDCSGTRSVTITERSVVVRGRSRKARRRRRARGAA